jgi:uncharacterized protein with von Willebrand factor type A (vWA) domain
MLFKDIEKTAQVLRYRNEFPIRSFRKTFDILRNIFGGGVGDISTTFL